MFSVPGTPQSVGLQKSFGPIPRLQQRLVGLTETRFVTKRRTVDPARRRGQFPQRFISIRQCFLERSLKDFTLMCKAFFCALLDFLAGCCQNRPKFLQRGPSSQTSRERPSSSLNWVQYVRAKSEQIDRLEDNLETLIEAAEASLANGENAAPGLLADAASRMARWRQIWTRQQKLESISLRPIET